MSSLEDTNPRQPAGEHLTLIKRTSAGIASSKTGLPRAPKAVERPVIRFKALSNGNRQIDLELTGTIASLFSEELPYQRLHCNELSFRAEPGCEYKSVLDGTSRVVDLKTGSEGDIMSPSHTLKPTFQIKILVRKEDGIFASLCRQKAWPATLSAKLREHTLNQRCNRYPLDSDEGFVDLGNRSHIWFLTEFNVAVSKQVSETWESESIAARQLINKGFKTSHPIVTMNGQNRDELFFALPSAAQEELSALDTRLHVSIELDFAPVAPSSEDENTPLTE